jgi:hypothetical protein
MLSNKQQKENVTTRAGRERMMGGIDVLYRSGDIWVSVPWSIISAVVLSWATIRDVAIALCNGKSDCAHAISPPNLKKCEAERLLLSAPQVVEEDE